MCLLEDGRADPELLQESVPCGSAYSEGYLRMEPHVAQICLRYLLIGRESWQGISPGSLSVESCFVVCMGISLSIIKGGKEIGLVLW